MPSEGIIRNMLNPEHKIGDLFLSASGQWIGMVTGNREIRDKRVVYKTEWISTGTKGIIPEETITMLKRLLKERYGYEQP